MLQLDPIAFVALLGGALSAGLGLWYLLRRRISAVTRLALEEWKDVAGAREAQIDVLEHKVDLLTAQISRLEAQIEALRALQATEIATAVLQMATASPALAAARDEQTREIARLVVEAVVDQVLGALAARPRRAAGR